MLQIIQAAENCVKYKKDSAPKKPCISNAMIAKMEEKKKWKSTHTDERNTRYRQVSNTLRRVTDAARERWR